MEPEIGKRKSRLGSVALAVIGAGLGLATLCALGVYFFGARAYATAKIAEAKRGGVFPTAEEAFVAAMPKPGALFEGAHVIGLANVQCQVNARDGSMPFLWFCMGDVLYDSRPRGHNNTQSSAGGYVLQVQGGWVWMPEGAFPELVGSIMQKYHLEGVK